jgi:DNA-binding transcriptional LysR family regulator
MDLRSFARGREEVSVQVSGWLTAGNAHRDMVVDLVRAGHGVARILDWTNRDDVASGALVQALPEWASPEAPPVNLLYRQSVRRVPRVRAFIDFATDVFRELGATRSRPVVGSARPPWLDRPYQRASSSVKRARQAQ